MNIKINGKEVDIFSLEFDEDRKYFIDGYSMTGERLTENELIVCMEILRCEKTTDLTTESIFPIIHSVLN